MRERVEISKESANRIPKGKTANTIPCFNKSSRFGGVRSIYPMRLPITSNSWETPRLLQATWAARGPRSLPWRAGGGSFGRGGTVAPSHLMTTSGRRFQLSFSHQKQWTMNSRRMIYLPPSKVSASVARGSPSNSFTLTRCLSCLPLSSRFFNFWRHFCDSFLCRTTKVSRARICGLLWTQW